MRILVVGATGALGRRLVPALVAAGQEVTSVRGSSNLKAKQQLGWRLRYPSWREGFRAEVDDR